MTRVFADAAELTAAVGEHLGYSHWLRLDQDRVNAFADATGDQQWIHVDPARAALSPYGTTLAHGYLTLALLPVLVGSVVRYEGWAARLNYGLDKVRFPAPVLVGSDVRAGAELTGTRAVSSGVQVSLRVTAQTRRNGEISSRPALVAETLTLLVT
jgi:acyl dehydratase